MLPWVFKILTAFLFSNFSIRAAEAIAPFLFRCNVCKCMLWALHMWLGNGWRWPVSCHVKWVPNTFENLEILVQVFLKYICLWLSFVLFFSMENQTRDEIQHAVLNLPCFHTILSFLTKHGCVPYFHVFSLLSCSSYYMTVSASFCCLSFWVYTLTSGGSSSMRAVFLLIVLGQISHLGLPFPFLDLPFQREAYI